MKLFKKNEGPERNSPGLFDRLKQGLSKTRAGLTTRLDNLVFGQKEIDADLLDELEEILFTSDLGVAATRELIELIKEGIARKELDDPAKLKAALKEQIIKFLNVPAKVQAMPGPGEPLVIMVIGVNGVGKTTTIGKIGYQFTQAGKKVILAAGDTFRAAAVEQLDIWGSRIGAEIIKQKEGSDPSAVVYDALSAALARKADMVLIDTAGRLHTKVNLMEELQKVQRVAAKRIPGAPHQVWLVLDATTGQNAIAQAEMFHKALGVSDIILTKLDGTAKGGIVVGIAHQLQLPIRYIGIGEDLEDLRPFDAQEFVAAIFS
jgi:fused signal recognition particle receptor